MTMRYKNKKAISNIMATMFLVLLTIMAVGVLWGFVKTTIDKVDLSPEIDCLELKTKSSIQIKKACYNPTTSETKIILERALTGLEINNMEFLISSNTNTNKYECGLSCGNGCTILHDGETKTYLFSSTGKNIEATISLSKRFRNP